MLLFGGLVLVAAAVCLGFGLLVLRLATYLRPGVADAVTPGDIGLLGYVALAILATLLNVLLPLSPPVAAGVALVALGALWQQRHRLSVQCRRFGWWPGESLLALIILGVFLGSLIPGSATAHFDTGLYHLQAIRQVMEYPLILGVANIHMRFGYNSAVFPTAPLLTGGIPGLAGAITTNAVLIAFVALGIVHRAFGSRGAGCGRSAVFGVLVLILVLLTPLLMLRQWGGTPNTDIPGAIIVLYAFFLALRLSDLQQQADTTSERETTSLLLFAMVALAVTLKLSALPAVMLVLVPVALWWRGLLGWRTLVAGCGVGLAIGLPWMARGVATSGCLAYPQPSSCLPLPWRVHPAVAQSDIDWMRAWARRPDTPPEIVLADWSWFPDWVASLAHERGRAAFLVLAGVAILMFGARLALRRHLATVADAQTPGARHDAWILTGVAIAGIGFWFFSAPLIRYGQYWLVLPFLLAIVQTCPVGRWRDGEVLGPHAPDWAAGLVVPALAILVGSHLWHQPRARLLRLAQPEFPVETTRQVGAPAGLPLHVPERGHQCWDAPRLCTPVLRDGLVVTRFLDSWIIRDPSRGAP